jgi:hypothetical protein
VLLEDAVFQSVEDGKANFVPMAEAFGGNRGKGFARIKAKGT